VTALLWQWSTGKDASADDAPEKLLYPLEHAYTPAELAFEALKGADAAVAAVLVAAASAADCDLHLALVSIEERGSAEHTGYYGARRRGWSDEEDEEDFEVLEVHERRETLSDWRRPDGSPPALGDLPCTAGELCPPEAFADLEPDGPAAPACPDRRTAGAATRLGTAERDRLRVRTLPRTQPLPGGSRPPALDF
jgi:hypothetical protein